MTLRFNCYRVLFVLLLGGLSRPGSAIPVPVSDEQITARVFGELSYFNSSANYDVGGGSYEALPFGRYYRYLRGDLGVEYWLLPEVSALVDFSFAQAESYDGVYKREDSGPVELMAALRYSVAVGALTYVPELQFVYPFNKVDVDTDSVLTGEGAMAIEVGSWAIYDSDVLTPYGFASFRYRDGERASHLVYRIGSFWNLSALRPFVEVHGEQTVIDDGHTDDRPYRDQVTTRVDGSSFKFFAVNSNLLSVQAGTTFELSREWRMKASFDQTINGRSAAHGYTIFAGFEWLFGQNDGAGLQNTEEVPRVLKMTPEEKSFEPETPEYDPTLFEEKKPKKKRPVKRKVKPFDKDKALEEVQKALEN